MFVRTVNGDVEPGELGFTHCHEHLFVFPTKNTNLPEKLILDSYENTKQEISRYIAGGGGAVLDAQPFGAGRNVSLLKKLSKETDVRIVASTGLHKAVFYKPDFWSFRASVSEIADLFIYEIEEGMYDYDYDEPFRSKTTVRAGAIKIATDKEGLTTYYRKVFDAAVIAHKETGAPILTHTEIPSSGLEQAEYLISNGISREKIIISHMDREIDIDRNIKLIKLGVFLEYDTIARPKYHSDDEEISLIKIMIENGFQSRILIGMDSTRERFISYGGEVGLDYVLAVFAPKLKKSGVSDGHIEMITVKNPQRALSFEQSN